MGENQLKAVRQQHGYSVAEVIRMMCQRAAVLNIPVMSAVSLKTKISRWENGHEPVSQPGYRRLFREIYGRTNAELGFPPEPEDSDADELLARIAVARSLDAGTVELFRRQVDTARHVDRRFGGVTVLDQLRATIAQIESLLGYSTQRGHREQLAGVLTEASALAGWEALDRNAIRQAWDHHERAKSAAREAGSPSLYAHSTAQQAFILIDLGEPAAAVEQLADARSHADGAPALLRSWLAAAHGEGLAAAGHRDEALRAFDDAHSLLPSDPDDPSLPFLFLGGAHLDRWRGHALSRLGERDAITQLADALPRLPPDFVRARTGMLVDLAHAYAAAGDRDATLDHARQARRLAIQIKSDRQLRRLSGLVLPIGRRGRGS
ncbi:MAG TPA: tetratricopeptide repeat protein [Pseudonocardiaceae bacterium]